MLPKTTQYYKAKNNQIKTTQNQISTPKTKDTEFRFANIAIYIGKVKCPKCKQKGYLTFSHSTQIRHYISKVKGTRNNRYRTCTLTSITIILKKYRKFLNKKRNKNPNKSTYDKLRYQKLKLKNKI
jgi:hypothetical protein